MKRIYEATEEKKFCEKDIFFQKNCFNRLYYETERPELGFRIEKGIRVFDQSASSIMKLPST